MILELHMGEDELLNDDRPGTMSNAASGTVTRRRLK